MLFRPESELSEGERTFLGDLGGMFAAIPDDPQSPVFSAARLDEYETLFLKGLTWVDWVARREEIGVAPTDHWFLYPVDMAYYLPAFMSLAIWVNDWESDLNWELLRFFADSERALPLRALLSTDQKLAVSRFLVLRENRYGESTSDDERELLQAASMLWS